MKYIFKNIVLNSRWQLGLNGWAQVKAQTSEVERTPTTKAS